MIQKVKSFQTTDGSSFVKIEDAQKHELESLLADMPDIATTKAETRGIIAGFMLTKASEFADILTMTPKSLPAARKANGGKKTRKAQAIVTEIPSAA
jgi:hypothetical protein